MWPNRSMLWPALRHVPTLSFLQGAWDGYIDPPSLTYVSTAEESLFRADLAPLLAIRDYPMLLLYGRDDRTMPLIHGERLHAAPPHSQLTILKDGPYAVLQEGVTTLCSWLTAHDLHESSG